MNESKITRIGDKTVIQSPYLPKGTVVVVDNDFLDIPLMKMPPIRLDHRDDYDVYLLPEGHEPKIMLSTSVDVSKEFRYDTNNWFIRTFGSKLTFKYKMNMLYGMRVGELNCFMGASNVGKSML